MGNNIPRELRLQGTHIVRAVSTYCVPVTAICTVRSHAKAR